MADDMERELNRILEEDDARDNKMDEAPSTDQSTPMETEQADQNEFCKAFQLLNANDVSSDAALSPVEFDAVSAAQDERCRERAQASHGATHISEEQPPKRVEVGDPHLIRCTCYIHVNAEKKDVELTHPPIFPTNPGYDIELYYRVAMAPRAQIGTQKTADMPSNPIMIALPKEFARVLADVLEPPTVKFIAYTHFGDLADQLQEQSISSALVWVWPHEVPSTQHMLLVQHAIERHLQCGGTMELFSPPFELNRESEWRLIGTICKKMAEFSSGPARGFDARVVDFYRPIREELLIKHPAINLEINSRKGEDRLKGWQCKVFLNQIADVASNVILLPSFETEATPRHTEDTTAKEATAIKKRRKKPQGFQAYYIKDVKQKRQEIAPKMKQTNRDRAQKSSGSASRRGGM
ncbi:hypothetical protein GCK32_009201 [Trichostrongylus colubriformis]|uniref:Uncharacterized protein n=1 Tax=Trichostrongylus colubriformis TaxID=6319 RepID=A0AAN8G4K4_TRICO